MAMVLIVTWVVKQSTPIAVGEKKKASLLLCGWNNQSNFKKTLWILKIGAPIRCSPKKMSLRALSCIHELSKNPVTTKKTLQNWLFSWNNSTTIKAILTSEYFFVIYIKNAIILYSQIWAYGPNLCQNAEIWNTVFPFLAHSCARTINGSLHSLLPPNLQSGERSFASFTRLFYISGEKITLLTWTGC